MIQVKPGAWISRLDNSSNDIDPKMQEKIGDFLIAYGGADVADAMSLVQVMPMRNLPNGSMGMMTIEYRYSINVTRAVAMGLPTIATMFAKQDFSDWPKLIGLLALVKPMDEDERLVCRLAAMLTEGRKVYSTGVHELDLVDFATGRVQGNAQEIVNGLVTKGAMKRKNGKIVFAI